MSVATQNPATTTATLAQLRPKELEINSLPAVSVGMADLQSFELTQRIAKMYAASSLVPKEYQGNVPNCAIAVNMAWRIKAEPLMVMQNLVIVHGRPTWSAQFLISTVNTCGRFTALRYEFFGKEGTDEWGCRAWTVEKSTNRKLVGTDVTIAIAKAEGWYGKNGSKWKTIPQQMLIYRAASWWTRAYAPELSMGLHTADEYRDVYDATKGEDGSYSVDLGELRQEPAEVVQGVATPAETAVSDVEESTDTPHDPVTGEVIEEDGLGGREEAAEVDDGFIVPPTPPKVPMVFVPGSATTVDWVSYSMKVRQLIAHAPTLAWLDKLLDANKTHLNNMLKFAAEEYADLEGHLQSRRAALKGGEAA